LRKERPELFQQGEYLPLTVQGAKSDHVVAFARRFENTNVLVIVPRLVASLLNEREIPPIGPEVWGDTQLVIPSYFQSADYRNAFTGEVLSLAKNGESGAIQIAEILAKFPVAVLVEG
jgi:(1->4)-alpha-D-glucan 1-alpha-D-glucosylmutase